MTSLVPGLGKQQMFFANFGGIEKLFCALDQSLNSKTMNQCNIDFNFLEEKRGLKFHFIGTLSNQHMNPANKDYIITVNECIPFE